MGAEDGRSSGQRVGSAVCRAVQRSSVCRAMCRDQPGQRTGVGREGYGVSRAEDRGQMGRVWRRQGMWSAGRRTGVTRAEDKGVTAFGEVQLNSGGAAHLRSGSSSHFS